MFDGLQPVTEIEIETFLRSTKLSQRRQRKLRHNVCKKPANFHQRSAQMMLYNSGPYSSPNKEMSLDEFMFIDGPALDQRVSIQTIDQEYVVAIDVIGLAKDGCKAILENNILILKGERWQGRRFEAFQRKIRLGKNASSSGIRTRYHAGLLTIRVTHSK